MVFVTDFSMTIDNNVRVQFAARTDCNVFPNYSIGTNWTLIAYCRALVDNGGYLNTH